MFGDECSTTVDCNSEVMESVPRLEYFVDLAVVGKKDNCSSAVDVAVAINVSTENFSDKDA